MNQFTISLFLPTVLPLNQTLSSWEQRIWTQTQEALDCKTNSFGKFHRKCVKNSMEKLHAVKTRPSWGRLGDETIPTKNTLTLLSTYLLAKLIALFIWFQSNGQSNVKNIPKLRWLIFLRNVIGQKKLAPLSRPIRRRTKINHRPRFPALQVVGLSLFGFMFGSYIEILYNFFFLIGCFFWP